MRRLSIALIALFLATPAGAQTTPPRDNPEMARMFAEDQAVRENVKPEQYADMAFVRKMIADDAARRTRTRALLDAVVAVDAGEECAIDGCRCCA